MKKVLRKLSRMLPDRVYISMMYYRRFKRFPNLKNPKTFNEKLQWLKLYDRKPEYTVMVDKYLAKQYVADLVGQEYIIPTLGVWEHADQIDFDSLPDKFVLKWNHDSGSIIICKNKSQFDRKAAIDKLNRWEDHNGYWYGREWPYKNIPPRIIAEEYLEGLDEFVEYKMFCFGGKVKMVLVCKGPAQKSGRTNDYCDCNLNRFPFVSSYPNSTGELNAPKELPDLIRFAEKLSVGIPHLRVDTYLMDGKIYFGELTFFHSSGFSPFDPPEWDHIIGDWITITDDK